MIILARRWPSATFLLAPAPNQTFVQSNKDVYYVQGITISLINNFCLLFIPKKCILVVPRWSR